MNESPSTRPNRLPSQLGIIAGSGRFPVLVAEQARKRGIRTLALGIEDEADPALATLVDAFHWVKLGQLSLSVRLMKQADISQAIMAGRVRHPRAFGLLRADPLMIKVLAGLRSRRTDAMLSRVADVLSSAGVELLDSTVLMRSEMAVDGVMGRHRPRLGQRRDIEFGLSVAHRLAALDIGQSVVVRNGTVVAVEAVEGTNEAIGRAGAHVSGRFIVAKTARPSQDPRFDVPVVGPRTIEVMADNDARVLALQAHRVLLLDRAEMIDRADRAGIVVVGDQVPPNFEHAAE